MADGYVPVAINARIETEEVLGPLPEGWEKAPYGNTHRFFFVDHNSKSTTWVDPRTYHLRKHDIRDVVPGELPYGWEEAFDQVCGIYYIDHITQTHFLEGPWEDSVRTQVLALHEHMADEARVLEEQMELERIKREELQAAEAKVDELEATRLRIEQELSMLRDNENEGIASDALDAEKAQLQQELAQINNQLEQEKLEAEQVAQEHANIQAEIDEFQGRLRELKAVNDRLESENKELLEQAHATNQNLEEMRTMIEMEAAQRAALESYIKQLKNEVIQMYNPDKAEELREREAIQEAEATEIEVDAPLPEPGTMDMDSELRELQFRLDEERKERERLKELTETLEAERNRVQDDLIVNDDANIGTNLPEWIVELNINAQKSKTLRTRIAKKNPDNMEFREKVLKFTAAAIDSNEKPKLPEMPAGSKNQFAKKGRETAFGQVGSDYDMLQLAAIPDKNVVDVVENIEDEVLSGGARGDNDIQVSELEVNDE